MSFKPIGSLGTFNLCNAIEGEDDLHLRFDVGVVLLLGLLDEDDDEVVALFA